MKGADQTNTFRESARDSKQTYSVNIIEPHNNTSNVSIKKEEAQ